MTNIIILAVTEAEPFNWNNLVLCILALVSAWTAYRVEQRAKSAKLEEEKRKEDREKLEKLSATVDKVSEQTDGINAKLVAAEKAISKDEGKKEERAEVAERAATAQDSPALVKILSSPEDPVITKPAPKTQ